MVISSGTQLVMASGAALRSGSATASALVLATQLAMVSVAASVGSPDMVPVAVLVIKLAMAWVTVSGYVYLFS